MRAIVIIIIIIIMKELGEISVRGRDPLNSLQYFGFTCCTLPPQDRILLFLLLYVGGKEGRCSRSSWNYIRYVYQPLRLISLHEEGAT